MSSVAAVADEWWARDFGCSSDELRPARTLVQEHTAGLLGNPGIWILVAGGAPLISLPSDVIGAVGDLAQAWSTADVADAHRIQQQLMPVCPRTVGKVIGPAFIGYGSSESLDLRDASSARAVSSHEEIAKLRAACDPEEWDHGGSEAETERTFGVTDESGALLALSGYEVWNESIAHISIVTHPLRRGRGHGRAAVACAAQAALDAGLVPQYRTLSQNAPSMNIAKRLGFLAYGFSVYVRLGSANDRP